MASSGSVVESLEALIASVELDEAGDLSASIARALASKLDEARHSESGAVAMAISGIAKELRAVVEDLCRDNADDEEFVSGLFAAGS